MVPHFLRQALPVFQWGKEYSKDVFSNDLIAAVIVTIMLIPQSLAYALLAGLPPEMGLYASILPLIAYAMFSSSHYLAVGPVAVVSLMTAGALGGMGLHGSEYAAAAIVLAFISGLMLLVMGLFRLGFLANFLSHPVISGFMTAAILLIAASQIKHLLGIQAHGRDMVTLLGSLLENITQVNPVTMLISASSIGFLLWSRKGLKPFLQRLDLSPMLTTILSKTGPLVVVVATTLVTWLFGLSDSGVKIVGTLPQGIPPLTVPGFDAELWGKLGLSAFLISMIGFVESVSVAQTLAARKRQKIAPNQELIGLGAANVASAISGGYPVTGGFSRSVVNFDSGARTPAAGAFTAIGILFAALFLTPLLYFLPKAALSSIIIVAVLSLLDFSPLRRAWKYSRPDFAAVAVTILMTLIFGVETGVSAGVVLSLSLHLYRTAKPHIAVVGRVPGSEHFRNIHRHDVRTCPHVLTIRIDESLYFANSRYLEDYVVDAVADSPELEHVILMCSAVNDIDMSALEALEEINSRLKSAGVKLHMSEVKGPVTDRLYQTDFFEELSGELFLSQHAAFEKLNCN